MKNFTNSNASHELICDVHRDNTVNEAHLAKLSPTFSPPYSKSTKSGNIFQRCSRQGSRQLEPEKSCIPATRVVFPITPGKHTVLAAPLAEAFSQLGKWEAWIFWCSLDVKFTHVPALQRCTAATFILRIGSWNQCVCALNVFSGRGEKFMLTFNSGKSSLNFKTTFRNFEGMFNLWPGFQPRSPATATRACLWLMSFTWHFQPLVRSQTAGSAGRPPLPLLYIWMRSLSAVALQAGNGQRWVGGRGIRGSARHSYYFANFHFWDSSVALTEAHL